MQAHGLQPLGLLAFLTYPPCPFAQAAGHGLPFTPDSGHNTVMVPLLDLPTGVPLMAGLLRRRLLPALLALLACLLLTLPAPACPFCTMQGQTLTGDVGQASMVLVGTLTNAKLTSSDTLEGTTDLVVESVIKKHKIIDGMKVVTLPKYIPGDDKKYKFLVFCDVYKDKIDPYRGVAVKADCDIAGYIKGATDVKDKKVGDRLNFFFKYLDSSEVEISNDAYKEFGNADYKDYKDMAKGLPADTLAKWLKDPNTPAFRYGLYASMLGHCGKPEHAKLLRGMLEDPEKKVITGADGILAGYVLLDPKEGWDYVRSILKDEKKDFTQRYATLRAARFFHDSRPDVITRADVVSAVALLLKQSDIADLAIEDLRKWGCWEMTDAILALNEEKSHDVPIIRRSILRFALCARDMSADGSVNKDKANPKAAAFVADLRKKDAEMVESAEELLRLETTPVTPPNKTKDTSTAGGK
jgi:hypothetical protein